MLTPQLLAMLQGTGNAIKPPPVNPALIADPQGMFPGTITGEDEGSDEDNDEGGDDTDNAGPGTNLPDLTKTAAPQAKALLAAATAPAGAGGAAPAQAATASAQNPINLATAASGGKNATPEEKKGIWSTFLTHLHDNPDAINALLQFAAGAAAPPRLGQNSLSVISDALAKSYGGYRQGQLEQKTQATDTAQKQQSIDIEKQKADTQKAQADWDRQAGAARLQIDAGTAKSDEDLNKAKTAYTYAEMKSLGQDTTDAGAKQQMADKMAKAAIAIGMFKDENKAFLWATDSVLHSQGQTPAQLQQSMMKEATDNVMKTNPDYKPEDLVSAVKAAQTAYQYMVDNHLVEGTPQPAQPAAAPVAPAPAPGGVVAAPTAVTYPPAPTDPAQRVVGSTYSINGKNYKYMGPNAWLPVS